MKLVVQIITASNSSCHVISFLISFFIAPCDHGAIQLVGGDNNYGKVEVCFAGVWSAICSDTQWDNTDASVICRQLRFSPYGINCTFVGNASICIVVHLQYSNMSCIKRDPAGKSLLLCQSSSASVVIASNKNSENPGLNPGWITTFFPYVNVGLFSCTVVCIVDMVVCIVISTE